MRNLYHCGPVVPRNGYHINTFADRIHPAFECTFAAFPLCTDQLLIVLVAIANNLSHAGSSVVPISCPRFASVPQNF